MSSIQNADSSKVIAAASLSSYTPQVMATTRTQQKLILNQGPTN